MEWLLIVWVETVYNSHHLTERLSTKKECNLVGTEMVDISAAKSIIGNDISISVYKCIEVKKNDT